MTVLEALKGVLKLALIHDGLARGLREASKALDRRQAHMCVLNEGCEEEAYKKLVVALCGEHGIPLIKVPDGKMLGEWAGLCEYCCFPFFLVFPSLLIASRIMMLLYLHSNGAGPSPPQHLPSNQTLAHRTNRQQLTQSKQASSTAKATPAKWSTAPASSSAIGARSPRSGPSCSTTSKPSSSMSLLFLRHRTEA